MTVWLIGRRRTLEEVWLEVDLEDVAAKPFDRVVKGKDVDPLAVFDVQARMHVDEVAELDAQVVARHLVHLDPALLYIVRAQTDQHRVFALLAAVGMSARQPRDRDADSPDDDCVATE